MNEAELKRFLDGFNAHDVDAIMGYFAGDAVYLTPSGSEAAGRRVEGLEAIRGHFAKLFRTIPDLRFSEDTHWVSADGTRAVSDWLISGTEPGGKAFAYRGTDHFTLRGGKVLVKDTYQKVVA